MEMVALPGYRNRAWSGRILMPDRQTRPVRR